MHEVSVTKVYCAFNSYVDGEGMRLGFNVRKTHEACEIFLRHLCNANCTVILRVSEVNRKCSVRFQISEENCRDCIACSSTILLASFKNRKMHLCVAQDFHHIPPVEAPTTVVTLAWYQLILCLFVLSYRFYLLLNLIKDRSKFTF